jgi:hypothetical protein
MNITAEEIAVYDANEDQIKEVLSKLTQAQQ